MKNNSESLPAFEKSKPGKSRGCKAASFNECSQNTDRKNNYLLNCIVSKNVGQFL